MHVIGTFLKHRQVRQICNHIGIVVVATLDFIHQLAPNRIDVHNAVLVGLLSDNTMPATAHLGNRIGEFIVWFNPFKAAEIAASLQSKSINAKSPRYRICNYLPHSVRTR